MKKDEDVSENDVQVSICVHVNLFMYLIAFQEVLTVLRFIPR